MRGLLLALIACEAASKPPPDAPPNAYTDPTLATWYADADADGFGDPADTVSADVPPSGYVANGADCDDDDPTIDPDQAEICDDLDQDCDGLVDEDVRPTWYPDLDADGFGDADGAVLACDAPPGHLPAGDDCDDDDPAVHPGADERCGDGVDDDCWAGDLPCPRDGDYGLDTADVIWRGGEAGDDVTDRLECGGDFDGDGQVEALIVQPEDRKDEVGLEDGTSRVWLVHADGRGERELDDEPWAVEEGSTPMDRSVARSLGDLDGDGADELFFIAHVFASPAPHGPSDSAAYFYDNEFGDAGDGDPMRPEDVAALGDRQFVLSSFFWNAQYRTLGAGAAFVFEGMPEGAMGSNTAIATIVPDPSFWFGYFGFDMCTGDLDGDGLTDLGFGSPGGGVDGQPEILLWGLTYLIHGPFSGDLRMTAEDGSLLDADAVIFGTPEARDIGNFGWDVSCEGDVSGDGLVDLLVGAPDFNVNLERASAAYYFAGPFNGTLDSTAALAVVEGVLPDESVGFEVELGADLDASGRADLVVAGGGLNSRGQVAVFYDGVAGVVTMADGDATFDGEADYDEAVKIAACPDLNGDGVDDLLIGAPGNDTHGDWAGSAYLILGGGS